MSVLAPVTLVAAGMKTMHTRANCAPVFDTKVRKRSVLNAV
jgi:hypothetical protein